MWRALEEIECSESARGGNVNNIFYDLTSPIKAEQQKEHSKIYARAFAGVYLLAISVRRSTTTTFFIKLLVSKKTIDFLDEKIKKSNDRKKSTYDPITVKAHHTEYPNWRIKPAKDMIRVP